MPDPLTAILRDLQRQDDAAVAAWAGALLRGKSAGSTTPAARPRPTSKTPKRDKVRG